MFNPTEYARKIRAERKEKGLCNCGRVPSPGFKLCDGCREQFRIRNKRYRDTRREREDCTNCGAVLTIEQLDAGRKQCDTCIQRSMNTQKRHKAAGRCQCGQPPKSGTKPDGSPYKQCQRCIDKSARQRANR